MGSVSVLVLGIISLSYWVTGHAINRLETHVATLIEDHQIIPESRQYIPYQEYVYIHPIAESTNWLSTNKSGMIYDIAQKHPMSKPQEVREKEGECYSSERNQGTCVSFERCNPMLHLNGIAERESIVKGKGDDGFDSHLNLRNEVYQLMRNKNCSSVIHAGESMYGNVCCPLAQPQAFPTKPPFSNSLFADPFTPKPSNEASLYASRQCGVTSIPDIRIVNGSVTVQGELPWMVVLFGKSGKQTCGGSLISEDIVLTAAHCISSYTRSDVSQLKLHIGDWNLRSSLDGSHETRRVTKIIKHKHFNIGTFTNDIALLKMDKPVTFSNTIQPICLPNVRTNLENRELIVAGWGRTSFKGPTSDTLKKVKVRVWDNPTCSNVYKGIAPGGILNSMICAGDKGKDSCVGDSGGPLMHKVGSVYYQVGIVSFGKGCATLPGVYTRVSEFSSWISANINKYF